VRRTYLRLIQQLDWNTDCARHGVCDVIAGAMCKGLKDYDWYWRLVGWKSSIVLLVLRFREAQ
jgi:hypothetical protein